MFVVYLSSIMFTLLFYSLHNLSQFNPIQAQPGSIYEFNTSNDQDRSDNLITYGDLSNYSDPNESLLVNKARRGWSKKYRVRRDAEIEKIISSAADQDPWLANWAGWKENDSIFGDMCNDLAVLSKTFVHETSAYFQNEKLGTLLKNVVIEAHNYVNKCAAPKNWQGIYWGKNWYSTSIKYPSMLCSVYADLQLVSRIYDSKWLYDILPDIGKIIESPVKAQGISRSGPNAVLIGSNLVFAKTILGENIDWNEPNFKYLLDQLNVKTVTSGEGLYPDYSWIFHKNVRALGYITASMLDGEIMAIFQPNDYYNLYKSIANLMCHPTINNNNTSLWHRDVSTGRQMDGGSLGVVVQNISRIINVKKPKYFAQIIGPTSTLAYYESDVAPGNTESAHYWLFYSEPMTALSRRLYSAETCRYLRGVIHNGKQFKLSYNTPSNTHSWDPTEYSASACATLNSCTAINKKYAIKELNEYFNENKWAVADTYTTIQNSLKTKTVLWSTDQSILTNWHELHHKSNSTTSEGPFTMFDRGPNTLNDNYRSQFMLTEHCAKTHTGIIDICFDEGVYSFFLSTEPYKTIQDQLWITLETGVLIHHATVKVNGVDVGRFEFEDKVLYVLHGQYASMQVSNKLFYDNETGKEVTETTVQAKPYAMHVSQRQKDRQADSVISACIWLSLVDKSYDVSKDNIAISILARTSYLQEVTTISIRNYHIICHSAMVILEKIDNDHYNGIIADCLDGYHTDHYVNCLGATYLLESFYNDKFFLDFRETSVPLKWTFGHYYDNRTIRARLTWTPDPANVPLKFKLYRGDRAWSGIRESTNTEGCFQLNANGKLGKLFLYPGFAQGINEIREYDSWNDFLIDINKVNIQLGHST